MTKSEQSIFVENFPLGGINTGETSKNIARIAKVPYRTKKCFNERQPLLVAMVCYGLAWFGLVWPDLAWFGIVWQGWLVLASTALAKIRYYQTEVSFLQKSFADKM